MVDRIYIGQMTNGTLTMSALSITLPIVTFITAFNELLGVGGAPLCAIRMGEGKKDEAERILTTSFVLLIFTGICLMIGLLFFKKPLLFLFGATDQSYPYASTYMTIYVLGTLFVQISMGMNPFINTQGFAKKGMTTVLIGAILNILLDPLFIFIFDLGVAGAALATIISQGVSCVWVLKFLFGKESTIKIRKEYFLPKLKICLAIIALGSSPFVMSLTDSLVQISFNKQLLIYGGTTAIATMSILASLWQFIFLPLSGLCQGAQPILSYNYGAGNLDRVRYTFKLVFRCCLIFALIAGSIVMIFSPRFVGIFTSDESTLQFASWATRIYLFGTVMFGAQLASQQSFMALGQAKISLLMAINRKVVLLVPLLYLLPRVLEGNVLAISLSLPVSSLAISPSGAFAVFLAEPVSDIISASITTWMFRRFYHKELV